MDELEAIEKLARRAREERPPETHVEAAVLETVRAARPVRILPLSLVAAAAAVAAAVVLTLAVDAWTSTAADPQSALFPSLEVASYDRSGE
jgi:hypothetical protein